MAGGGDRLNEKDENDRGKDGTKRKGGEKEYYYNNRNRGIRGNIERRVEEWLEREIGVKVSVREPFKINKDKMMLTKTESWERKKNIMVNKCKLKKRKGERMYLVDDLTNLKGKRKRS
jgi:hypothetical protein